jgi:two-component system CheB/CheR fusion protein
MSIAIAGIGASAGGIESFCELIAHLPAKTGMAYVFVQHLDPAHRSHLVQILSKWARFPVEQAREGVKTVPDHLFVIAPNTTLTSGEDVLHTRIRDPAESPHRPIDIFFRSLAEQRGIGAIGIVLSGTGSDGAKGIQAIKQAGGTTFAQDKSSALFFGMPSSAIKTGCVDFILAPADIAQELIRISQDFRLKGPSQERSQKS